MLLLKLNLTSRIQLVSPGYQIWMETLDVPIVSSGFHFAAPK